MKKLLVTLIISMCALAAHTQQTSVWESFHLAHKNSVLTDWLSRHIQAQQTQLPWVAALKEQVNRTHPKHGIIGIVIRDGIPAQIQPDVSPAVRARLDRWQKAAEQNKALPHLFVKSLTSQSDVARFNEKQVEQVEYFLQTGYGSPIASITPQRLQCFKHYLIGVILPPAKPGCARVQLLFNAYAQEVYVTYDMSRVPGVPLEP